jgi:Polyketide cyclase / dehydrase and lipid transport.
MKIVEPRRVTRTYTQTLVAPPAAVLPLLCPVREADWIPGWDPVQVISCSGLAEPDCVFVTSASPHDAVWYVTRHDPAMGCVEMIKITPEVTACRLQIALRPTAAGCEAVVTYTHTSLGPGGDEFLRGFTEESYVRGMRLWEARLNHYLTHGVAMPEAVAS